MAEHTPINWAYPFKSKSGKTITDPQVYFEALANAAHGSYPMGVNGLWHGGVHFDAHTGALLDQSEVRCIVDGDVIAYRIDEQYPETCYEATATDGGPASRGAQYSTGFVLVKHHLALPPVPPSETPETLPGIASDGAASAAPATETLTFYSLYMHLLDWAGYQAANAPKPAAFLAPATYAVSNRTSDPLQGLRVRQQPSGGTTEVLALLPKGCKVTLGEADSRHPHWRPLVSVDEGAAVPALPADTLGWVFANELTHLRVADQAKDIEPGLTRSHPGLNVRKQGQRTGAILAVLPQGATLKVGAKQPNGYCKVLEVMDYRGVPALPKGSDGQPLGYVYFEKLDLQLAAPSNLGAVHLLPQPHPIKAGELIGHLGLYQDHDDRTPKSRLHLEVFSCDDVPAFIAQSRARALSLPVNQHSLLKIHKGASKLIPHRSGINAMHPPKITDAGLTVGVGLTLPLSVLESLPADHKLQVSEPIPGSATPRITQWWRLDNLLADASGNPLSGWLAEQELLTTRHNPWEWEGFDFISETPCAADYLACHLDTERLLTEEEKPDYQAQISTADQGPIKTRLYDIIDGADGSLRDGKLTVAELKAALRKPWHAQAISRLVTHYESEWFWKEHKWDELDLLMGHTQADANTQWVSEKDRIKTLSWWSEIAGKRGISGNGAAWHIEPTALLANFTFLEDENALHWLIVPNGQLTFDVEGNDIDNPLSPSHRYFSRVVHWPGGASGVTIGRGYDLGQRPHPETDLASVGISEPLKSWLIAAKGLKGQAAKDYVSSASAEISTTHITRKQQYDLFNKIYDFMKNEVVRISNSKSNLEEYGKLNWDLTDRKIQDIAIDLIYRGDYTPSSRKNVQQHIIENNITELQAAMSDQSNWPGVPRDRFNKRAGYLR